MRTTGRQPTAPAVGTWCKLLGAKNAVLLLSHVDEGGAFGQFLQAFHADIGTGGTQTTKDIAHGELNFTT